MTYVFDGAYAAAATVEVVMSAPDYVRSFQVPLADGGLLTIMLDLGDGQIVDLVLPADSPPGPGLPGSRWRPAEDTPSLGPCSVALSKDRISGSMTCTGDADSAAGSATLEASWRVTP